jgi:hypothetical protein
VLRSQSLIIGGSQVSPTNVHPSSSGAPSSSLLHNIYNGARFVGHLVPTIGQFVPRGASVAHASKQPAEVHYPHAMINNGDEQKERKSDADTKVTA